MTVFETIQERRSYRSEYKKDKVPRSDLQKILEAGLAAPSGCNAQTTYFIGLDDPQLLEKAAKILGKKSLASVPAGILVISHVRPSYKDTYFNVQDYSAAIENMLLAITALGYASCWIEGEITCEKEKQKAFTELFSIPEKHSVVAFLPVGVPVKTVKSPDKKAFEERAFYNSFLK